MLNLQNLVYQFDQRFRAYLEEAILEDRVGWRLDPWACPIANWLLNEDYVQPDFAEGRLYEACPDRLRVGEQRVETPHVLALFIRIIDNALFGTEPGTANVSRQEALLALQHAEHLASKALLPERAESLRAVS